MFILLNGSFGIGKTTVARLLADQLSAASIYNPERVGYVLRRLPPWLLGRAKQPDDFQDLWLWRYLIVRGARHAHRRAPIVIVPMAFSNQAYLDGFCDALSADAPVRTACLVAPLSIVRERLHARAHAENASVSEWQIRHSEECCDAHTSASFGYPVNAIRRPQDIVDEIRQWIGT